MYGCTGRGQDHAQCMNPVVKMNLSHRRDQVAGVAHLRTVILTRLRYRVV